MQLIVVPGSVSSTEVGKRFLMSRSTIGPVDCVFSFRIFFSSLSNLVLACMPFGLSTIRGLSVMKRSSVAGRLAFLFAFFFSSFRSLSL